MKAYARVLAVEVLAHRGTTGSAERREVEEVSWRIRSLRYLGA